MNGEGNGKTSNGGAREVDPSDPFARGVWVLTFLSGADAVALVDGSEGREDQVMKEMLEELKTYRSICVDLRRKTILKEIVFPLPERTSSGQMTGRLTPGSLPSACRHENTLELIHDFVTHATLTQFTFLNEMHPENVERLRGSVCNAEESAENAARLIRSNLVSPQGMDLR